MYCKFEWRNASSNKWKFQVVLSRVQLEISRLKSAKITMFAL